MSFNIPLRKLFSNSVISAAPVWDMNHFAFVSIGHKSFLVNFWVKNAIVRAILDVELKQKISEQF